jgi:3-methyladenine DNA glycosylase AlkD
VVSKSSRTKETGSKQQVQGVLDWLKAHSTKATLQGMARYAIPSAQRHGRAMKDLKALGKQLGRQHELALALWDTGWYEARILTSFVADPAQLTAAQMDRWCRDFDNWAFCDTLSFNLFDRSPHAWAKVQQWSRLKGEFQKRTAFALLWSLALHDKQAGDEPFLRGLEIIEGAAGDDRNFVKKAVNMALRAIGRAQIRKKSAAGQPPPAVGPPRTPLAAASRARAVGGIGKDGASRAQAWNFGPERGGLTLI